MCVRTRVIADALQWRPRQILTETPQITPLPLTQGPPGDVGGDPRQTESGEAGRVALSTACSGPVKRNSRSFRDQLNGRLGLPDPGLCAHRRGKRPGLAGARRVSGPTATP